MKNFEDLGRDFDIYMQKMSEIIIKQSEEIRVLKDRVSELEAKQ